MRIFLDGTIFSTGRSGGIIRTFQELLPRMTHIDSSVRFTLYLRRKLRGGDLPTASGIDHLHERSIYPMRWLYGKYQAQENLLDQAYYQNSPDIFHATFYSRPPKIRTPYVVSVYDMIHEIFTPLQKYPAPKHWQFLEQKRQSIQAADLILTNSHYTTHDLPKYCSVDEKKIVTIPLGVSLPFSPIQDENRKITFLANHGLSKPFFLYVGARRFNKNFMGLFRAYAGFKYAEDIDLVAIGDDNPITKEELIFMNSLSPKGTITHLKIVNEDELALAYNTASALIFPSLYEGFGLPVVEAMACGTPVLASNASSIPEVAGEAALYFNPNNPDEIRAAMEAIFYSDTATTLKQKGLERARLFNWDDTAKKTLQAYKQLV